MHLCYDKENVHVKLIDFGLAQRMSPESEFKSTHFVGKLNYHSPEIFNRSKPFDARKNDIWTIGVALFMLVTGGIPYSKPCASDTSFAAIMDGRITDLLQFWQKMDYVNDQILEVFGCIFQFEEKR